MTSTSAIAPRALWAHRLCTLVGLAFSVAAAVDYYGLAGGAGSFCASGSGCDAVRHSSIGTAIGAPLPAIGVLGFAFVLLAGLVAKPRLRILALSAGASGGLFGLALLALQAFAIGQYCPLCVGADVAGALGGASALLLLVRDGGPLHTASRARGLWAAAAMLALGAPPAWALSHPASLPPTVAALGVPGKINVVELSDFECPYCRAMHPALAEALAPYGERVHFVRKTFPLPGHRHARDASRAFVCAQAQGHGEAMANMLFAAPDLSRTAIADMAAALGIDSEAFEACTQDPATDARITADMQLMRDTGFEGLPTVWIGDERLTGFDATRGSEPYAEALARAAGESGTLRRWLAWAAVALTAMLAYRIAARERTSRRR